MRPDNGRVEHLHIGVTYRGQPAVQVRSLQAVTLDLVKHEIYAAWESKECLLIALPGSPDPGGMESGNFARQTFSACVSSGRIYEYMV